MFERLGALQPFHSCSQLSVLSNLLGRNRVISERRRLRTAITVVGQIDPGPAMTRR